MSRLNTSLNLDRHDDLYAQVVDLFDNMSEPEALTACAKLVLLLANHIGDEQVVSDAVQLVHRVSIPEAHITDD